MLAPRRRRCLQRRRAMVAHRRGWQGTSRCCIVDSVSGRAVRAALRWRQRRRRQRGRRRRRQQRRRRAVTWPLCRGHEGRLAGANFCRCDAEGHSGACAHCACFLMLGGRYTSVPIALKYGRWQYGRWRCQSISAAGALNRRIARGRRRRHHAARRSNTSRACSRPIGSLRTPRAVAATISVSVSSNCQ
jgi:hypothetical protein